MPDEERLYNLPVGGAKPKNLFAESEVNWKSRGVPAPTETSPRTIPTPIRQVPMQTGLSPEELMLLEEQEKQRERELVDPLGGLRRGAQGLQDELSRMAQGFTSGSSYGRKALRRDPFANNKIPGIDDSSGYIEKRAKRGPGRPPKKNKEFPM